MDRPDPDLEKLLQTLQEAKAVLSEAFVEIERLRRELALEQAGRYSLKTRVAELEEILLLEIAYKKDEIT